MAPSIIGLDGRVYSEGEPDYDKVRIDLLREQVGDLITAVVDLQNRVSRQDAEPLHWPADTYGPTNTKSADV